MTHRNLLLCGGLQSSGSTLFSWCFLQRHDTDGVLDSSNDCLFVFPADLPAAPFLWCKTTIACFRFRHVRCFYEDAGFSVRPLLVARDVRSVFCSLVTKDYGRNGVTAEDPPLRMRFRRFKEDWEEFRAAGWPIVTYESLVEQPETTLREACRGLDVPWDPAMMTWPKKREDLAFPINGNPTFLRSLRSDLVSSIQPDMAGIRADGIAAEDLRWLEEEFRDYNVAHGYPLEVACTPGASPSTPSFEVTHRADAACYEERVQEHYKRLEEQNAALIEQRAKLGAESYRLAREKAHLANEVEELTGRIGRLQGEVKSLNGTIGSLTVEVERLRGELAQKQAELTAALNVVNRYRDYPERIQEIKHLRRHLALFENHPLLGPILRLRRRIQEMLGRSHA